MTPAQCIIEEIPSEKITLFQDKIFSFYKHNKRDLPWRHTTDPYKILLSELMLQQTQVSRVTHYYHQWIERWPTIDALATTSLPEVLQMWMGLGYNRRAVHLHTTACIIVTQFNSDVLRAMQQYKTLPGIGRYTSQAVLIFSTNADLVTVDTNIRRILIREFDLHPTVSDADLWTLAQHCLPPGRSREWHNALMDYGALHLTARKTGIKPKTQQSRFEGSDRQIRAQILRCLLQKSLSLSELENTLHLTQDRLQPILEKMMREHLIVQKGTIYRLKE